MFFDVDLADWSCISLIRMERGGGHFQGPRFMFLINPPSGNVKIQKMIPKHICECFEKGKGKTAKLH